MFVNLARRADRRTQLASTLAAANTVLLAKLARIDAVDGRLLDLEDESLCRHVSEEALRKAREAKRVGAFTVVHEEGRLVKFHDHLTAGGVACVMSHHAALVAVAQHPTADWGLILEDDITGLVPQVHEAIFNVVERLPQDWDAVFLGYHGGTMAGTGAGGKDTAEEHARALFELQMDAMNKGAGRDSFVGSVDPDASGSGVSYDVPVLRMYMPVYGLYAWVVRKEAARALLEGAFPVNGQVDHAITRWLVCERGRAFRVAPRHLLFFSPKSEDGLDSDIQTMARLQTLLDDPEMCERYMAFVNANSSAEL